MRARTVTFPISLGLVSLVLVGAVAVDAAAQDNRRTYRVRIDSTPPGATVYIDDREAEPVGQTPHDAQLTSGKHTIYVELDGHVPAAREISVRARRRRQTFAFPLDVLENGSVEVIADDDQLADGADVLIDGDKVGVVPDSFDVPAGDHVVEVVKDGYAPFKQTVTVTTGEAANVLVSLSAVTAGDGTDDELPDQPGEVTAPSAPSRGAESLITLGAGVGVGTRQVAYDHVDADMPELRDFDVPVTAMAQVDAALHLGRLVPALRSVSVFGQLLISAPIQSNTEDGVEDISTLWLRREVGLRGSIPVGPVRVIVEAAEGGDALTFDNFDEVIVVMDANGDEFERETLPDVTYEYLRGGLGLGARVAGVDVHAQVDGVFVIAAGEQVQQFQDTTKTDIVGLGARVMAHRRVSGVDLSAAASLVRFQYDIADRAATDPAVDGAVDQAVAVSVSAGYAF